MYLLFLQLDILLNGNPVDALASIVHKKKAYSVGKKVCEKLKENIHRYMYVCMYWLLAQLFGKLAVISLVNSCIFHCTLFFSNKILCYNHQKFVIN